MEPDIYQMAALFSNLSTQLRGTLANFRLAASQLIPTSQREADPALDAKAAVLDQGYYQMLRLINNLSSVAALCSEDSMPMQDRDLVDLVRGVCGQSEALADLCQLQLRFSCPLARLVCAVNRQGIEQLLFHLLSNALRATPAGGSVTVELKKSGAQVLLSVTDTGCGIDEHLLPILFDRYLHDEAGRSQPHGRGLGLFLCHQIAQAHGGSLMAESKKDVGSRFTLSLPDRKVGKVSISDVPSGYAPTGFNPTLLALADALPSKAWLVRNQE